MTFKEKYKEELSDIRFTEKFEENTVTLLMQAAEGKDKAFMNKTVNKMTKILIAAVLIIVILSSTAFAISKLLSAGEVAGHFGESQAAKSFDKQLIAVESVTDKGYTVSFLGLVKGEKIESKNVKSDCSYYVVAVAAADGSPLSLIEGNPLGVSVIIEGYPAWKINSWSLNTSANGMEEDGILYYLYDCEDLEIFADKNVYLAVYEGMLPDIDTVTMNTDGTFEFSEGYDGFRAMFRLSLDASKANPEKANEILREYLFEEPEIASEENEKTEELREEVSESEMEELQENASEPESELTYNSINEADEELIPESEMEPMPNYKDKWRISFSIP